MGVVCNIFVRLYLGRPRFRSLSRQAIMSKNTFSTGFRKVDVDELDEEQFRDEPETQEDAEDDVGQREQEVKKLTQSGNNLDALKVALENPPLHDKNESLKKRNFDLVLDVLTRFRPNDVKKAVESLQTEQVDTLVKYIYRGFAQPNEKSCGILLVWHQHAVDFCGLGCIVRVLTSRKTV